jgi:hypothetical protein
MKIRPVCAELFHADRQTRRCYLPLFSMSQTRLKTLHFVRGCTHVFRMSVPAKAGITQSLQQTGYRLHTRFSYDCSSKSRYNPVPAANRLQAARYKVRSPAGHVSPLFVLQVRPDHPGAHPVLCSIGTLACRRGYIGRGVN